MYDAGWQDIVNIDVSHLFAYKDETDLSTVLQTGD